MFKRTLSKYDAEMERLFRSQFRHEEGRLVFRRNAREVPVPVTHNEMEKSVALFLQRQRQMRIPLFVVPIAIVVVFVALDGGGFLERDGSIFLFAAVFALAVVLLVRWQWRSSTDMFSRRAPLSNKVRSRGALRADMLREWGWPKLLGFIGLGLVLSVPQLLQWPPQSIDEWMWFLLGLFLVLAGIFNAGIKWRLRRTDGAEL